MAAVVEKRLASGWQAVALENGAVSVLILPEKGGEIYELRSRAHDLDVLWKSPWGLRPPAGVAQAGASSETAWLDAYGGGWQELFPNGGAACTYMGAELGFHGEVSVSPFQFTIDSQASGGVAVHMTLALARSPFVIEKTITLDAELPRLTIGERITNHGTQRMPYMWGHHPAYGAPFLSGSCELTVPAHVFTADKAQTAGHTWLTPGVSWPAWPKIGGPDGATHDLSKVPPPEAAVANMGYILQLDEGWYSLVNHDLGLGVGLSWPLEVFPVVWLWQELNGSPGHPWYGRCYVMGVEPNTSALGHGLVNAIQAGQARWLDPGQQVEMTMCAVLFEPAASVRHISPTGQVQMA